MRKMCAVVALALAVQESRSLSFLDVGGNRFSDAGVFALGAAVARSPSMTTLFGVTTTGDKITTEAIAALCAGVRESRAMTNRNLD